MVNNNPHVPQMQRSPRSSSSVPIMFNGVPTTLSSPTFSLIPSPRRVSGQYTESAPSIKSPGGHSFRAGLRSLLPFGKPAAVGISSPVPSRNPFTNFSRRSISGEELKRRASAVGERPTSTREQRRASGSHFSNLRSSSYTASPTISIDASSLHVPSYTTIHGNSSTSSSFGVELEPPVRVGSAPPRIQSPVGGVDEFAGLKATLRVPLGGGQSPEPPTRAHLERALPALPPSQSMDGAAGDLSTIMEADTSGMSKHIPADSSLASIAQELIFAPGEDDLVQSTSVDTHHPDGSFPLPSFLPSDDTRSTSTRSRHASWLELEIDEQDVGNESVIVSDVEDVLEDESNVSFNLEALDPDLAALLSPNRMPHMEQADAVDAGLDGIRPPSLSPSPEVRPALRLPAPDSPMRTEGSSQSTVGVSPAASNSSRTVGSQSSPRRRSLNMSHNRRESPGESSPVQQHIRRPSASGSTIPRLVRQAASQVTPLKTTVNPLSPVGGGGIPRRQPSSPLAGSGPRYQPRKPSDPTRRPPQTRLTTPRQTSLYTPVRPSLRTSKTSSSATEMWENDSVSPSSRAPSSRASSSLGGPSRLQHYTRPNHDVNSISEFGHRAGAEERARKRSMSVDERGFTTGDSGYRLSAYGQTPRPSSSLSSRPSNEWLGPRTQKAFAAAGLLDYERNTPGPPEMASASARVGAIRSNSERDYRSLQAPSRTAFSESAGSSWGGPPGSSPWPASGSSASWGRSSGSARGMSVSASDTGRSPFIDSPPSTSRSPVFSAARTAYSSGSTAPTSEYGAPSAMQLIRDKHDVETGALLSALSDSQRTSKVLREENTELRERLTLMDGKMREMGGRLEDALRELEWRANQPPAPPPPLHRMVLEHRSRAGSVDTTPLQRQPPPLMRASSSKGVPFSHVVDESTDFLPTPTPSEAFVKGHRKKFSTSSSIFPVPPPNMTLLMGEGNEEDDNLNDMMSPFSASSSRVNRSLSFNMSSPHSDKSGDMSSPDSPTIALPKQRPSVQAHPHKRGASSGGGNGSPAHSPTTTMASFSMTGSPGSLFLRPEHEMHLGDMVSLDLGHMDDSEDDERSN